MLRVNHKSERKTNKFLRERDGERSDAHAAPGNITSSPHRRLTQLDEGCSPIMRYWRKRPRLQRWWRDSLGRRQKGLAKGIAGPSKRVWNSYKTRLTWSQNSLLDAIFFWKVSHGRGCDVKRALPCVIWNHHHGNLKMLFPGSQSSSITSITAAESVNINVNVFNAQFHVFVAPELFDFQSFQFVYSHICFPALAWVRRHLYGQLNRWLCAGFWLARLRCFTLTFNGLYKLQICLSLPPSPNHWNLHGAQWPPRVVSAHFPANPAALLLWWQTTNKSTAGL